MNDEQLQYQLKSAEEMGKQARAFLQSDLGQHLDQMTQQSIEQAKDDLFALDPYAFATLVDLQNAIMRIHAQATPPQVLRQVLSETILRGDQASHMLDVEESTDGA